MVRTTLQRYVFLNERPLHSLPNYHTSDESNLLDEAVINRRFVDPWFIEDQSRGFEIRINSVAYGPNIKENRQFSPSSKHNYIQTF